MSIFSPRRTSQAVDRLGRLQTMMDMPFGGSGFGGELANLGGQVVPGALTTYGLGTAIREGMTPQGNTVPDAMPGIVPNPAEALGRLAQNIGGMIRQDEPQPSLSEDEYKTSPYFRTEIPFEQGMTEDRAAALATFYDQRKVAEYFAEKRPVSSFVGQFIGQAFDPINYVPVFGQAAEAAMVARLGTIGGRMVVGAADGAVNTAIFGALTTRMREEFGDDTSWNAMINEIGMSALVGGAFGGVSPIVKSVWRSVTGRIDRAAEARAANLMTDARTLKESRAVLNEVAGQVANGQDVNLSPNSQAVIERIQAPVIGDAASTRALRDQTANVTGENVAITPSGQRVNVQPEIVDASTLVRATGDLQVRNRSSLASRTQVEQMATELDPMRLMPSIDADSGAPIVGRDNVIDSGNGRVMAIVRAYEAYPERAGAYRKALKDAGYIVPPGVERPVLINRRTTELSRDARAKFNEEANAPRAAQMNAVELATMDRNALDGALDVLDAAPVTAASNRAFVQRFLGNLTPSARGALIDGNGALNADGARRIENALVAEAYGDVDANVLRRFAEATDDNTRAIVGAMSDAAGRWAQMRREVKAGSISPEFDATTELTQALRLIGQWRDQASKERRPVSTVIKEGMGQIDLLDGQISPEAQVIISAFYKTNAFSQAAGRDTIAEFLGRVVDAAMELGRPQLFETADVGKLEVLRNAAVNEQGNLFTPISAVDGIEADGSFTRRVAVAADRQDGGQGAGAGQAVTPPPAEGMVRMYHGGRAGRDDFAGTTDFFSTSKAYAEGYARKNWGDDGAVYYVDVPRDNPMFDADYADQSVDTGFTVQAELPTEMAGARKLLVEPSAAPVASIGGQPVRLGAPPTEGRASLEVASIQASLLDNTPATAAARVAKDDTRRDIALSHGVDPNTGAFVEQGDIEQIRQEGRLTSDDEAELAAADQMFADAEAWGRALDAATRCIL